MQDLTPQDHFTFLPPPPPPTAMHQDETFNFPDGDIILRALGPPSRDFRVHKLVLSLASPIFEDMFSLPQPTPEDTASSAAEVEIVQVTDPPEALDIVLRLIYPAVPPSSGGCLDTLVECLVIADKYEIEGAKARLRRALAQHNAAQPLRVYAIASRFGFANLADSASNHILSVVHLPGIPDIPDDFKFVPATVYHKLVRHQASYIEAVVKIVNQTSLQSRCDSCAHVGEIFRLRLAHLIITGTPVEAKACFSAWVKAYGPNTDCKEDCVLKFICIAISRVNKGLVKPCVSPLQKKKVPPKGI